MISISSNNIFITKNDSAVLKVTLKHFEVITSTPRVIFVVKKKETDLDTAAVFYQEPEVQSDGTFVVTFLPADTDKPVGKYYWGFKIIANDDTFVNTPIVGQFFIQGGIVQDGQ
jgi:hypothetical protein